jgi:hypothetical protein
MCFDVSIFCICFAVLYSYLLDVCGSCNCVLGITTLFHSLLFSSSFVIFITLLSVSILLLLLLLHIILLQFDPLCPHCGIIHLHLFLAAFLYVTVSVDTCCSRGF